MRRPVPLPSSAPFKAAVSGSGPGSNTLVRPARKQRSAGSATALESVVRDELSLSLRTLLAVRGSCIADRRRSVRLVGNRFDGFSVDVQGFS